MIHPQSNIKLIWSLLITVIVLQTAIFTPVRIAFSTQDSWLEFNLYFYIDVLADVIFLLDILLIFVTLQYDQFGVLVTNRATIALKYL